jgi:hypothetical protein
MNNINSITEFSRAQFARFFSLCKSFFSEDLVAKIEKYLNFTHSFLVPLSAVIVLISAIIFAIKISSVLPFFLGLIAVVLVFFGDFISEKFHSACSSALEANPTSISSNAYLELIFFLSTFLVVGLVFSGVYFGIQTSSLNIFLGCLAGAALALLATIPVLNPQIINMSISEKSSAASDLIGLSAIGIKSMLYYSSLFARLVIIVGALLLLVATYQVLTVDRYMVEQAMIDGSVALGILFSGLFYPVLVYLLFMAVFFVADILLAVLSLKEIKVINIPTVTKKD